MRRAAGYPLTAFLHRVTQKLHSRYDAVEQTCYLGRMTLSEFREQTALLPEEEVRHAIAAALPGRTLRTHQDFSAFYEAVCRELQGLRPNAAGELVA